MPHSTLIQYGEDLKVDLDTGPDIADLSSPMEALLKRSGIQTGVMWANVVGSTGSLTTIEFEPGVVTDLKAAIDRLAPRNLPYAHELAWHDGNGHSHVQAALLGPSLNVAIRNGRFALGTWQQMVVINHDNRPRQRTIAVILMGRRG
ncbi:MAG: secondary thiamine-phosphate synthase enzyme YjbQ [Desulfosarcinaceae bacterium]|nr:secondary thiamine-phosphate synthase enzyme YjbQ [Desulfosarcinaceae bacterium]